LAPQSAYPSSALPLELVLSEPRSAHLSQEQPLELSEPLSAHLSLALP
jgi:hypothetical protein